MDIWQKFQTLPIEDLESLLQQAADLAELAYQDEAEPLEERALMCHNVGERFYYAGDCERAVHFLEMAYELASKAKEYDNLSDLLLYLIRNYYWLGNMEKAKEYGILDGDKENALKYFEIAAKTCWLGGNTDAYFMVRKIAAELQR